MLIHCCGCGKKIAARLTSGREIYSARPDLADLPFWKCDACGNHVGCHHKTAKPTKPLGCIPTPELTNARRHIHRILDPLWKSGRISRGDLYAAIGERTGRKYHTAQIRTIEEARTVYRIIAALSVEIRGKTIAV